MNIIGFTHPYRKLLDDIFTTMRSLSYVKKLKVGEIVEIKRCDGSRFKAIIRDKTEKRIEDMTLQEIKDDAEYEGLEINSHQDFLDLINSFYPRNRFEKARATIHSKLGILTIEKIK